MGWEEIEGTKMTHSDWRLCSEQVPENFRHVEVHNGIITTALHFEPGFQFLGSDICWRYAHPINTSAPHVEKEAGNREVQACGPCTPTVADLDARLEMLEKWQASTARWFTALENAVTAARAEFEKEGF